MTWFHSVCPYDCPDACGLLVDVEGGKATRVKGNPDHTYTRGTLCPKMAHYEKTVHSPRRLTTPLKRTGPKGAGEFMPISWDEAIQTISSRWKDIIEKYGAEAIQPYSFAGTMGIVQHDAYHGLFRALGASELERTICSPAKKAAWATVFGSTMGAKPQESQDSDFLIIWGMSVLSTGIHFLHDVEIAKSRGTHIVVVDVYENATAKRLADTFIRVKPGTDGALALGLLYVLWRDGLTDDDFLARYVQGWDALCRDILPKYMPENVADLTGVPAETVISLAHAYGKARAPFIRLGTGLSRRANGSMNCRCILCLPAAVGAFAKEGGGILGSSSGAAAYDRAIMERPDMKHPGVRSINMIEIGRELLTRQDPPIMSLFVYSSNPADTAPDQNAVLQGLRRDDLFTVVHERFLTDTANYADIVLPATSSLEHDDVYYGYGHYTLARGAAVIPPVGESRSNWDTACLLAHAMGLTDSLFDQSESDLVEQLIASTKKWPLPVDMARLAACEPVDLPLPVGYKVDFKTPSGKVEIYNPAETPALPDYFPAEDDMGEFALVNGPDPRILDSSFNERDDMLQRHTGELWMNPADAARLGLTAGEDVVAWNQRGDVTFHLVVTDATAEGVVVTEGVWWKDYMPGGKHNVNALTSDRNTDKGKGSTFYQVRVNIKRI